MIDDILEAVVDFFLDLFFCKKVNSKLRKTIPNSFLRWTVTTLIYLLVVTVLVILGVGIYLLVTN